MADGPEMFGPTRGFSGMADSMEPCKMLWADPCCHCNEIWARRGDPSPTGLSDWLFTVVDVCGHNNGGCSSLATCTHTQFGRKCTCNTGYTGNGLTCTGMVCLLITCIIVILPIVQSGIGLFNSKSHIYRRRGRVGICPQKIGEHFSGKYVNSGILLIFGTCNFEQKCLAPKVDWAPIRMLNLQYFNNTLACY